MKTRIRYKEISPGILKTIKNLVSQKTGASYSITLYLDDKKFEIRNVNSRKIVKRGGKNINNLVCLKRAAKRTVARLGVVFEPEIRIIDTKDGLNE